MKRLIISILTVLSSALLGTQNVAANDDEGATLTGNWDGLRSQWMEQGVNFEAVYTGDLFSNRRGGVKRSSVYLDNLDVMLTLDGEKLFDRPGLTLFLYGLGNNGDSPSDLAGDLQGLDNIDAPATGKIYEAWLEQSLCQERCSVESGCGAVVLG